MLKSIFHKSLTLAASLTLRSESLVRAQTYPPPVNLMDGATIESSSLEDPARPANFINDGNFAGRKRDGSCTATDIGPNEWLRIEMSESFPVRTIVHANDEDGLMTNFFYHVGDNPDISLNPKCQETAYTDGGIYNCDKNGKYFGITTVSAIGESSRVRLCELKLYSRRTAVPFFSPGSVTGSAPYTTEIPSDAGKIGLHCGDPLRDGCWGNGAYWITE